MTVELLKTAAAQIDTLVKELETAQSKIAELTASAAQAKTASAAEAKVANEAKAAIAEQAKTAAAKLREVGLLSSDERRDAMAAKLASDSSAALELLTKCAEMVRVPKLGSVVVDTTVPAESANAAWDRRVASGTTPR